MFYEQQIVIERPIDEVVELFKNPDNLNRRFPNLISHEHLDGSPGMPGARSKMVFKLNRGQFELIETINVNNLPDEFSGFYDTVGKGISNTMATHFIPISEGSTLYKMEINYKFGGLWKLMGLIMRRAFRRQSYRTMERFKDFAEGREVTESDAE
jgi:uncharacterized membrane protein